MLVRIRDFLLDFPILLGDRTFVGRPQARCLFLVPVVARCERTSVLVVELLELQLSSGALGLERLGPFVAEFPGQPREHRELILLGLLQVFGVFGLKAREVRLVALAGLVVALALLLPALEDVLDFRVDLVQHALIGFDCGDRFLLERFALGAVFLEQRF